MQRARDDRAIRRRPSPAVLASAAASTQAAMAARDEAVIAESEGDTEEDAES